MIRKKTKAGFVELFELLHKYADEEKIWGYSITKNEIRITTGIEKRNGSCEE